MRKNWLLTIRLGLVVVLGLGVIGFVGCTSTDTNSVTNSQQQGIWVSGEGTVTVIPDIVNLNLGIQAQEASVAQAQSESSQAMNRVMTTLKTKGVADKDIQTQHFSIQKVTRWDDKNQKEVVIGYMVTNLVNARIRAVDKVGTIIDAVAAVGGDLTQINSISFSVDKPETYYGDARVKAMADAEAKAKQLASLSGIVLGKPTYISEGTQLPAPIVPIIKAEAAAPTPISPGETEISLTIQVVYAIGR